MSQKRDKVQQQRSSPTSSSSEEPVQRAVTFLPPFTGHESTSQHQQDLRTSSPESTRGTNPFNHRQYGSIVTSSTSGILHPNLPSAPYNAPSSSSRRQALPLADILLQEPIAPTLPASRQTQDPFRTSPISPQQPDLSPLRLYGDPESPGRSRHEYFDPARSSLETYQEPGSSLSRPISGYPTVASSSRSAQNYPASISSSPPLQSSAVITTLSSVDRERLTLTILQQPEAARACGHGERDRRVVDPPPILQLRLLNYNPSSASDRDLLRSPFNLVQCLLIAVPNRNAPPSAGQDVSRINDPNDPSRDLRRLMGSLTISPFIGIDRRASPSLPKEAKIGTYYIFSDLSCRQNGLYRLKFVLTPVDVNAASPGGRAETATTALSDVFEVFSAKDFPGMQQSSELTKELKRQGAAIPIKKGNEGKSTRKGKKRGSDSDGSTSDASEDAGLSRAAGKKPRS